MGDQLLLKACEQGDIANVTALLSSGDEADEVCLICWKERDH